MKQIIKNGPHGFTTYKDFRRRIGSGGKPVVLDAAGKSKLLNRLIKLEDKRFFPYDGISEDLMASGRVCEVRELPDNSLFVRYEVHVLLYGGTWDGPYQLLVHWSSRGALRTYTLLYGRGWRKPNFAANLHIDRGNLVRDRIETSRRKVVSFLKDMRSNESLLIGNDDCSGDFVTFGYEDGELIMSWQVCSGTWGCNSVRGISIKEAVRAVSVFAEKGIVGIQESGSWEGVEHYDSVSKETEIDIDLCLRRHLFRALRTDDVLACKTLLAIGVSSEEPKYRPCEVRIGYGSPEEMFAEAFSKAIPWKRKRFWRRRTYEAMRVNKVLTYLSLQGYKPACLALSERFFLGDTLPKNDEMARQWKRKGA